MLTVVQAVKGIGAGNCSRCIKAAVVKALQFFLNKILKLVLVLLKSKYGFINRYAGIKTIFIV